MLDITTKRRIDSARDILVGKVPDPKSQVEQITIALIYKFMDDMDTESEEMGGERTFFQGEFEKYAWHKILDKKIGGYELISLYAEAFEKMDENPNVPQLFRDIFKNAYLPYRDPETLRDFLKEINGFEYEHSERLGDAFEYLLSVMSSQGDAGQFRTPRHIIDFMVDMVDPQKNETILDPACGTSGFLISSYKHILKNNSSNFNSETEEKLYANQHTSATETVVNGKQYRGDQLKPEEKTDLGKNVLGYDISPDMVRLSLVNMYLHGIKDPHIAEYDTLSRQDKWNEYVDVILANPPFMSPKGGIKPHNKFSIQSKRSEVLFVDYMADHLTPNGRTMVIVPEGVIFQAGTAYKSLRKKLVDDNFLVGVISLPSGVFNPYSGVKTSILWFDRSLAKKTDKILFLKVENDGFDLGAQRRPIKLNDLPGIAQTIKSYKQALIEEKEFAMDEREGLLVEKAKIAEDGEYNLTGEKYKIAVVKETKFPLKSLSEISTINPVKSELKGIDQDLEVSFVPMADLNENNISFQPKEVKKLNEVIKGYTYFADNDVLLAKVTPCFENGKAGLAKDLVNTIGFGSSEFYVLRSNQLILPELLYYFVTSDNFKNEAIKQMTGTGGLKRVPKSFLSSYEVPVPPLNIQEEIIEEIQAYQKIINGARQIVENYKPIININPEWEMVDLGSILKIKGGYAFKSADFDTSGIQVVKMGNVKSMFFDKDNNQAFLPNSFRESYEGYIISKGDILISMTGTVGKTDYGNVCMIDTNEEYFLNQRVGKFNFTEESVNRTFIYYLANQDYFKSEIFRNSTGGVRQANISSKQIESIKVPLPPIEIQDSIVKQIEEECLIVNQNKRLIEIFEQKIKDKINSVWGN
ncbi:N-6 DNA methylase [Marinifilum flexuosum]|uniref:N-6 DNA methylase n=1 Tax=Marinifilum flexuosum TaxID=1117708 RepID=UPI0024948C31|nr:N-6 DNA methylase [Marinifilum flexuosum]